MANSEFNQPGWNIKGSVYQANNIYIQSEQPQESAEGGKDDRRMIHLLLPWLVDRHHQMHELGIAIKHVESKTLRPMICLIHGNDDECHDKFVDLLEKHSLRSLIGLNPTRSVLRKTLRWPSDYQDIHDLHSQLERTLAEQWLNDTSADKNDINNSWAKWDGVPILIDTYPYIEDWKTQGDVVVRAFLEFWQHWPQLPPDQWLIVCVCINCIKPQAKFWQFWRNRQSEALENIVAKGLEAFSSAQFEGVTCVVLPQLEAVSWQDLHNWATSNETREYCPGRDLARVIKTIFQQSKYKTLDNAIPMRYLAEELQKVLDSC
jgi:hypothetical protein